MDYIIFEIVNNVLNAVLNVVSNRVDDNLRIRWILIRRIDASEIGQEAGSRFLVQTFDVSFLAFA